MAGAAVCAIPKSRGEGCSRRTSNGAVLGISAISVCSLLRLMDPISYEVGARLLRENPRPTVSPSTDCLRRGRDDVVDGLGVTLLDVLASSPATNPASSDCLRRRSLDMARLIDPLSLGVVGDPSSTAVESVELGVRIRRSGVWGNSFVGVRG